MSQHLEIIPEDGAMRALVLALRFQRPNYATGIGDTLNKIESDFKNRFALGIVDDDKRKPKLFDQYEELLKEQGALQLRRKPKSRHFLVVVQPAIEMWLLQNAAAAEISPSKYGFSTLDDLKLVTKNEVEVVKNQRFKQWLNDLNQAGVPGFAVLADWIDELYERHF